MDVNSAEMVKLTANAFLSTRISFINEIANVCERVGADVEHVAKGVGLDHRLGPHFLRAGIGFGGSCFPKDVSALKQLAGNSGYHFQLLAAVIEVNELQKRRVVAKLEHYLGTLRGNDDRAARPRLQAEHGRHARGAVDRARRTGSSPRAPHVRGWDPIADAAPRAPARRGVCRTPFEAIRGADAAVIVTEWPELHAIVREDVRASMRQPLLDRRAQHARPASRARRRLRLRGRSAAAAAVAGAARGRRPEPRRLA